MKTVETILAQMTDTKAIMQTLKETLLELDPCYAEEAAAFLSASAAQEREVGDTTTPSAIEYLAAMEQKMASNLFMWDSSASISFWTALQTQSTPCSWSGILR